MSGKKARHPHTPAISRPVRPGKEHIHPKRPYGVDLMDLIGIETRAPKTRFTAKSSLFRRAINHRSTITSLMAQARPAPAYLGHSGLRAQKPLHRPRAGQQAGCACRQIDGKPAPSACFEHFSRASRHSVLDLLRLQRPDGDSRSGSEAAISIQHKSPVSLGQVPPKSYPVTKSPKPLLSVGPKKRCNFNGSHTAQYPQNSN